MAKDFERYVAEYRKYAHKTIGRRTKTMQMRVAESDMQTLDALAARHGLSRSEVIRVLLFREARTETRSGGRQAEQVAEG